MFKYLITQKVFILVVEARPSMDGLDLLLAPNRSNGLSPTWLQGFLSQYTALSACRASTVDLQRAYAVPWIDGGLLLGTGRCSYPVES